MAEWVPLLQTLVWPIFIGVLIFWFRNNLSTVVQAITERIKSGASVKAGPIELGTIAKEMEKLPDAPQSAIKAAEPTDWRQERAEKYRKVDGYMLVHVYRPSTMPSQKYDIFVFIVRHQKGAEGPPRRHFTEIAKAEFFFGDSWGNKVFEVENSGDIIGVQTHAWGTFLACCRVTFKDVTRDPIILYRYVDFHMLQDHPEGN
jgi:hypothetical protein